MAASGIRRRRRRRSSAAIRAAARAASTCSCSATSPPTPATTRSRSASRTRSACRASPAIKAITVDGATLRCEQEVPGGRDVYEVAMPAVVTVKEGINLPRYPSVPGPDAGQAQAAGALEPAAAGRPLEMVRLVLPAGTGKQAEVLGHGARRRARGRRDPARDRGDVMPCWRSSRTPATSSPSRRSRSPAAWATTSSRRSRSPRERATRPPPGRQTLVELAEQRARLARWSPPAPTAATRCWPTSPPARPADGGQLHVGRRPATRRRVTRMRWGGSLLEEAQVHGSPLLLTVAPHAVARGADRRRRAVAVDRPRLGARPRRARRRARRRRPPPASRWPMPTWSSPAAAGSARPRASR